MHNTAEEDDIACKAYLAQVFPATDVEKAALHISTSNELLLRFAKFAHPSLQATSFVAACDMLSVPVDYAPGGRLGSVSRQVFLIAVLSGLQPFAHSEEQILRDVALKAEAQREEGTYFIRSRTSEVKRVSMLRISNAGFDYEKSDCSDNSTLLEEAQSPRTSSLAPSKVAVFKESFSDNFSEDYSNAPDISIFDLRSNYMNTQLSDKIDLGDCPQEESDRKPVKVLICGGNNVGKTKLALRMLTGEFLGEIGEIGRFDRNYEGEGGVFRVVLREEYNKKVVRWASVCLVCFSLMDRQSFEYAKSIIGEMVKWGQKNIILVGCKGDERLANISSDEIMGLFSGQGIKYISCSALRGIGIVKLISQLETYLEK